MTPPDERPDRPASRPDEPPSIGRSAVEDRADAFGREVEAAATHLTSNPGVRAVSNVAGRVWGLVILAIGLWFLARVTLHLAVPDVASGEFWPLVLITLGLVAIAGAGRRA